MWMEHPFETWKKRLHIRDNAGPWRCFQVLRTFLLVTFIKVLPEVGGLRAGLGLWKQIFTEHSLPHSFDELLPFVASSRTSFYGMLLGVGLMLFVSLVQRKQPVRAWLEQKNLYPVRLLVYVILVLLIFYIGVPASGGQGGFMYAQF